MLMQLLNRRRDKCHGQRIVEALVTSVTASGDEVGLAELGEEGLEALVGGLVVEEA